MHVSIKSGHLSVKYNEKVTFTTDLPLILFNVKENLKPMSLDFAVLTATILPGFIIAQ
jgi:hypothetical protein